MDFQNNLKEDVHSKVHVDNVQGKHDPQDTKTRSATPHPRVISAIAPSRRGKGACEYPVHVDLEIDSSASGEHSPAQNRPCHLEI